MPVIPQFSFEWRSTAPNHLTTTTGVVLSKRPAYPFAGAGDQHHLIFTHWRFLL